MLAPAAVIGGLALTTLALHFRDPHAQGSWGLCPSAAMGIDCPGCGGLRAVNDLTNLRLADAASSNLLLIVLMPVAVFVLAAWAVGRWRGRPVYRLTPRQAVVVASALALSMAVFTVVRNLPGGGWLAS